jgi:hypothetical protein
MPITLSSGKKCATCYYLLLPATTIVDSMTAKEKEDAREGREDAGNDFGGNLDEDFWREKILELI